MIYDDPIRMVLSSYYIAELLNQRAAATLLSAATSELRSQPSPSSRVPVSLMALSAAALSAKDLRAINALVARLTRKPSILTAPKAHAGPVLLPVSIVHGAIVGEWTRVVVRK